VLLGTKTVDSNSRTRSLVGILNDICASGQSFMWLVPKLCPLNLVITSKHPLALQESWGLFRTEIYKPRWYIMVASIFLHGTSNHVTHDIQNQIEYAISSLPVLIFLVFLRIIDLHPSSDCFLDGERSVTSPRIIIGEGKSTIH